MRWGSQIWEQSRHRGASAGSVDGTGGAHQEGKEEVVVTDAN